MDDQATIRNVEDPIFDDFGAGVESGLWLQIEGEGGVGDFDQKADIGRLRPGHKFVVGLGENDGVGFGIARWIVFRTNVYGNLLANGPSRENRPEPFHEQHEGQRVRVILTHFLDQLPVDEFVFVQIQDGA